MNMEDIEIVARAMAVADGLDPDSQAGGGPNEFVLKASEFTGNDTYNYAPLWHAYKRSANQFLAAMNALDNCSD